MATRLAFTAQAASSAGKFYKLALVALAGLVVFPIFVWSKSEIMQDADHQIAREERAFCLNLGLQAGARYESCIQDISRLVRREEEIRSMEF